jgi:predicted transposase/invertase (TIGR01784 family)
MKNFTVRSSKFDPLNDFLFYKVFGEKGDEVQLLGFINAVLGKTGDDMFTSIIILENKSFTPENIGDKLVTFDVRAVLQDKTKVNVEVQLRNEYNMDKRSLFHWSREFSRSLKSGQDFSELPDVIAINIVDFDYLDTKDFHSCFHLRDDKEQDIILNEVLEIHFINMVRYRKIKGKDILGNPLFRWLAWFDRNSKPEILTEVVSMDVAIQKANERLYNLTSDDDILRAYDMQFTAMCDETSRMNYAREKGIKKGKLDIARKMKKAGRPDSEIAEFTDLSPETIERL